MEDWEAAEEYVSTRRFMYDDRLEDAGKGVARQAYLAGCAKVRAELGPKIARWKNNYYEAVSWRDKATKENEALREAAVHFSATVEGYFSDPDIYECRSDEDCDHCHVDQAMSDLDAVLAKHPRNVPSQCVKGEVK